MDNLLLVKIPQSELNATLERLSKLGVTQEHFKRVRSSRKYAKLVAEAFLGEDTAKMSYDDVRAILGKDFITPEEIATARKLTYTYNEDQLQHFADTLPSEEELLWLRDNGFMLVAGPSIQMSLLEVRSINNKLFYAETEGWYANEREKFARDENVNCEWLMLRKTPVANSTSKTWNDQQKLISEVEFVPNAAEVCWALTTFKEVRGEYLLPNIYVRTSSVDADGYRVCVGGFVGDGLDVSGCSDDGCSGGLGVASARKRNLNP